MKINTVSGNQQANTIGKEAQQKTPDVAANQNVGLERTENGNRDSMPHLPLEAKEVMNDEMLQKSVDQANKSLTTYNRRIERMVHEVTHTVMYTIRDTETNEVIREFPPKKIQDMIAKMWELAGLFVDEKA